MNLVKYNGNLRNYPSKYFQTLWKFWCLTWTFLAFCGPVCCLLQLWKGIIRSSIFFVEFTFLLWYEKQWKSVHVYIIDHPYGTVVDIRRKENPLLQSTQTTKRWNVQVEVDYFLKLFPNGKNLIYLRSFEQFQGAKIDNFYMNCSICKMCHSVQKILKVVFLKPMTTH